MLNKEDSNSHDPTLPTSSGLYWLWKDKVEIAYFAIGLPSGGM